ncbi:MAG TPA: signal peptidase II [Clostridiaceae bacterium]|nr:signal peptidase II [Clostridiaceae bacterium]
MIWILIMALIIISDQITKHIVSTNIKVGELIPVINNFFYITYHTNTGAAWGILQDKLYILIPLTIVFSLVMFYMLFKTEHKLLKIALSFILGGAIGNLIDRVVKGSVVDFLDFYFGKFHFPTFNIADCFIVIGTILLGTYIVLYGKEPEEEEKKESA